MSEMQILDRIKTIINHRCRGGRLELISYKELEYTFQRQRSISIANGRLVYHVNMQNDGNPKGNDVDVMEYDMNKPRLAAILFEIGEKKDRERVKRYLLKQDYEFLCRKLEIK